MQYNITLFVYRDTVAAVKYINDQYRQETAHQDNSIPLKSLRIEKDTVFYQRKTDTEYLVLLSDFEVDVVSKQSKVSRGSGDEKAGSSGSSMS